MTKVFIASNIDTAYPRKLQKPANVNQSVRDSADTFIMDSGIGDDEISNADVLNLTSRYNADFVIAKDYLGDPPQTTESVAEFLDLLDDHECDATPMIPLQPPHSQHYHDITERCGEQSHYVLGGMAVPDCGVKTQIQHITAFGRTVHDSAYIHALGVGGGRDFVRRMAPKQILDSVDCATPELAAMNGRVICEDLRQETLMIHSGEGNRKRVRQLAAFNSWQIHDAWNRAVESEITSSQTSLGECGVTE
jgi:hypothetical protein